jgi:hypothetical protein
MPYYIGKGSVTRAFSSKKGERIHPPKDRNLIVICERHLTNIGACAIERRLIRLWGRKGIDNNGILRNITPGGEGGMGWLAQSEETRNNIKRRMIENNIGSLKRGSKMPQEWKENLILGIANSDYDISKDAVRSAKISQAMKGKSFSLKHRENIGKSSKGRIPWNKETKGLSKGAPGKRLTCSCICCKMEMGINNINRHYKARHNDTF